MSLTRALFNEFRPVFQMLDDPFDPFSVVPHRRTPHTNDSNSQVSPWNKITTRTPHVHLTDEADKYVVEAEVPGVPKENLDVSIGDNGRSVTIKGNTFSSSELAAEESGKEKEKVATESQTGEKGSAEKPANAEGTSSESTVAKKEHQSQPRWSMHSSFERKIWLAQPVDAQKVAARLEHGILTLEVPKLQAQTHRITVA
ncbi:hypothetical protein FRC04_006780 [Tulasnella sp. 424]|nr:hypothetical protein FRC04_006780 [Tulasnella sp. 424]KAG8974331.1 hypothetical protein FRC05_007637 [Tulasnella sp. 425]